MSETVLSTLLERIRTAASYNRGTQLGPAVVLWTDPDGQWQPAIRQLKELLPSLLVLGDYQPERNTGPAIWLKCMLARVLPEADWPQGEIPVVYLPGISRLDLRAVEQCPRRLQPLAELQYRGVTWNQVNGKDWTVNAFLTAKSGGLALDISQDKATQTSLKRALHPLLETPVDLLRGKRLSAGDFDALLSPDVIKDLLLWLDQPEVMEEEWSGARWEAFVAQCRQYYQFDPAADGALEGAEKLAEASNHWAPVWERFGESVAGYPGLVERLFSCAPPADLFADKSHYPKANADAETALRHDLEALTEHAPDEAKNHVKQLDHEHGARRQWVWASRGESALAIALEPLAALCSIIASAPDGTEPKALGKLYAEKLWEIDYLAVKALSSVKTQADMKAVSAALQAVYVPWLSANAASFQAAVKAHGYPGLGNCIGDEKGNYQPGGQCVFFVDGLRFDVGRHLSQRLDQVGFKINGGHAWTPFPSVTASGKAWFSPVADKVTGRPTDKDFEPGLKSEDKPLTTHNFRKLLDEAGWQVLKGYDLGDPKGNAWLEFGDLDHFGHEHGLRLAHEVDRACEELLERVQALFDAGWKRVTFVTDHGWLLVPGCMPKVDLNKHLTDTRWGRCALMKPGAQAPGPVLSWGWCSDVAIASAPGISAHRAGLEYAHGGLSLQECLVPVIDVMPSVRAKNSANVEVTSVKWLGLRCRVETKGAEAGFSADLRAKANSEHTSFCGGAKAIENNKVSLAVLDDDSEGTAAILVILDGEGRVIDKKNTVVGG